MEESQRPFDPAPMRRLGRDPERLEVLRMFSMLSQGDELAFNSPVRVDAAAHKFGELAAKVAAGPDTTLDGWRAQLLFESTVAALGRVRMIKGEDSGDVHYSGDEVRPPDFRVVEENGRQFLVDVKLARGPAAEDLAVKLRRKDIDAYRRYGDLVGVPDIRLAVYWAELNWWTLTPLDTLNPTGSSTRKLRFLDAVLVSDMVAVGDSVIGTEWPIALTLVSDASRPRRVADDGKVEFTTGDAYLSVAGRRISDAREETIASLLMRYGGWEVDDTVDIVDGEIMSVKFAATPLLPDERQAVAMHRSLSSVFARRADDLMTTADGRRSDIRLSPEPNRLRQMIPDDYEGEVLKLWRFKIEPNQSANI